MQPIIGYVFIFLEVLPTYRSGGCFIYFGRYRLPPEHGHVYRAHKNTPRSDRCDHVSDMKEVIIN